LNSGNEISDSNDEFLKNRRKPQAQVITKFVIISSIFKI
jgi:hypothetical protein